MVAPSSQIHRLHFASQLVAAFQQHHLVNVQIHLADVPLVPESVHHLVGVLLHHCWFDRGPMAAVPPSPATDQVVARLDWVAQAHHSDCQSS